MKKEYNSRLESLRGVYFNFKRSLYLVGATLLIVGPLTFLNQTVSASQITNRSLSISSSVPAATSVTYIYSFEPATTGTIQSIFLQSCTTAVGACTAPSGINLQAGTMTMTSGWAGSVTSLTKNTTNSTPACNVTTNMCYTWTDATNQTAGSALVATVTGETNPGTTGCTNTNPNNCTFFVRMTTYSDNALTTAVDSGTVAAAITQTYTVNATVQEQLSFCVGSVNGSSASVATVTYAMPNCTALTGTSLSLGTLSNGETNVSPVSAAQPYNGDLNNGVVELDTNAANGSSISYSAVQQSGTNHDGALRVSGATCAAGTSYTDQCINSIGSTAAAITAGTEDFGMAAMGINCYNVPGSAYTCNATSHNLTINSNYYCNATDAGTSFDSGHFDTGGQTSSATLCNYAWDETGTSDSFATATNVVGGEAALVEFAATPEITTPTGAYTAQASFIATPTY